MKDKSIVFLRYIDDTFMAWTKPEKQLKDFMNELNKNRVPRRFQKSKVRRVEKK